MAAPRIVKITVDDTVPARFPYWVTVSLRWDQPVNGFKLTNLVLETQQEPGITITGYKGGFNTYPPKSATYLGQTLISNDYVAQSDPYTSYFKFQVSPFARGPFQVSNQPWNKPMKLEIYNSEGVPGDFSALLAPGSLSQLVGQSYYDYDFNFQTVSVLPDAKFKNYPKIKNDWTWHTVNGKDVANSYTGFEQKVGTGPNNWQNPDPLLQWFGGNFWWWEAAGARYGPFNVDPDRAYNYYSTDNPATCQGPNAYLFGGYGGLSVPSTFMPVYGPTVKPDDVINEWGSKVANNLNPQSNPTSLAKYYYNPQTIFGPSTDTPANGRNYAVGRWEGWLLANPQKGDPLKNMPSTWTRQLPGSTNNYCLAPWRLAKDTDPVPMLFQAYFQYDWIYDYLSPPPS